MGITLHDSRTQGVCLPGSHGGIRPLSIFLADLFIDLISTKAGSSHSSHRNSRRGSSDAFHASRAASIQRVPVLLVTDDKRMARRQLGAGAAPFVRKLKEYESILTREVEDYGKSLGRD